MTAVGVLCRVHESERLRAAVMESKLRDASLHTAQMRADNDRLHSELL